MSTPRDRHPSALPPSIRTLGALVRHRAAEDPDHPLYTHLADGEAAAEVLTAGALDRRARALAHALAHLPPGSRVLLPFEQGLDFAPALVACTLAGHVGVPVPSPAAGGRGLDRLRAIAADAAVAAVLTTPDIAATATALRDALPGVPWLTTDVDDTLADRYTAPQGIDADTPAYLQYTSGSTADPKGVVIDHDNLFANCRALDEAYHLDPESVMVYWVPTYHDLGLVYGVVVPLWCGGRAVSLPPAAFIARPIRWLRAISAWRGTHSVAPDFAFDIAVHKTRPTDRAGLDLTAWRHALNGAEPIRHDVERAFIEAFAPHGLDPDALSHSYGMSEATAELTAEPPGERRRFARLDAAALERGRVAFATDTTARVRLVAGCGRPATGCQIAIIDPDTRLPSPPDHIGEVWLRAPSVARGYHDNPPATAATFGARRADDPQGPPWLRSGDLGFLHDGHLHVTGRRKDLVIIRGENHYPQDLERIHPGPPPCAPPQRRRRLHPLRRRRPRARRAVTEITTDSIPPADAAALVAARRAAVAERGVEPPRSRSSPLRRAPHLERQGHARRRSRVSSDGDLTVIHRWSATTGERADDHATLPASSPPPTPPPAPPRCSTRSAPSPPRRPANTPTNPSPPAASTPSRSSTSPSASARSSAPTCSWPTSSKTAPRRPRRRARRPRPRHAARHHRPRRPPRPLPAARHPASLLVRPRSRHRLPQLLLNTTSAASTSTASAAFRQQLIDRHDALRLVFAADGTQRGVADVPLPLPREDLRALDRRPQPASPPPAPRSPTPSTPPTAGPLFELRALRLPDHDGAPRHRPASASTSSSSTAPAWRSSCASGARHRGEALPRSPTGFRDRARRRRPPRHPRLAGRARLVDRPPPRLQHRARAPPRPPHRRPRPSPLHPPQGHPARRRLGRAPRRSRPPRPLPLDGALRRLRRGHRHLVERPGVHAQPHHLPPRATAPPRLGPRRRLHHHGLPRRPPPRRVELHRLRHHATAPAPRTARPPTGARPRRRARVVARRPGQLPRRLHQHGARRRRPLAHRLARRRDPWHQPDPPCLDRPPDPRRRRRARLPLGCHRSPLPRRLDR
ncbi:MAG: AMP-binding protein [bacterium]